jgi:hypothetical protein
MSDRFDLIAKPCLWSICKGAMYLSDKDVELWCKRLADAFRWYEKHKGTCEWKHLGYGNYTASCGWNGICLNRDETMTIFCPNCGRRIAEVKNG